ITKRNRGPQNTKGEQAFQPALEDDCASVTVALVNKNDFHGFGVFSTVALRNAHESQKKPIQINSTQEKNQAARTGFMYEIGTFASVSKLTISQASWFISSDLNKALFSACPDLYPLNSPIRLWPIMYRSPMASRILCFTNSSS